MNFKALQSMIQSLVNSHTCPHCDSKISEKDVDIVGAAGTTINLDIACPSCGKHSMIKSEVMSVDLSNMNIDSLRAKLSTMVGGAKQKNENSIKDEAIVDLNKNLKKQNCSVSDLFTD